MAAKKAFSTRNLVQCYSLRINRGTTHVDKKKSTKKGYQKHRHDLSRGDAVFGATTILKTTQEKPRLASTRLHPAGPAAL